MMNNDLGIVILSCDKYRDLWKPFLVQFRRHIPAGSLPIYLGSNSIPCEDEGVHPILSGDDPDWSTSCKQILAQIKERKLFVTLEDLFPASRVDETFFLKVVNFVFETDAKHVKYWPNPTTDEPTDDLEIGLYAKGAPYRATVCGFWDREYLMNLLLEGESAWDFEILGSYRTSYIAGFYGLNKPLFEFRNMIEKGCWIPQSVEWAKKEGIELDLSNRPMLKGGSQLMSLLKMAYFGAMMRVSWRKRVKWMNTLRRALISY